MKSVLEAWRGQVIRQQRHVCQLRKKHRAVHGLL
jgi:hypothetical protein